eukprot:TRINITY_DN5659_c0_g2_i2.p1 TRINITY_DN5659_c0_g2~~TRINITY_DN5659_c0_g2_i2.p1  ORF type:complete len:387 (+),score=104.52 TRINITY_DN5659_c0_g2_i2:78-1163(+)
MCIRDRYQRRVHGECVNTTIKLNKEFVARYNKMQRRKEIEKKPKVTVEELVGQLKILSMENEIYNLKVERLENKANDQQILITALRKHIRELAQENENLKNQMKVGSPTKSPGKKKKKLERSRSFEVIEDDDCDISLPLLGVAKSCFEVNNNKGEGSLGGSDENSNGDSKSSKSPMTHRATQVHVSKFDISYPETVLKNLVSFEEDLKRHTNDVYVEFKSFIRGADHTTSSTDIYEIVESVDELVNKNNTIKDKWIVQQKMDVSLMLENFVFECLYDKIFTFDDDAKAKSLQLQEKFYVLQNLITMDLLEIPTEYQLPSLFTYCQNELKKMNQVKSPYNKMRVIENVYQNLISICQFFVQG